MSEVPNMGMRGPHQLTASLLVRAAGLVYRPRRAEFLGELDVLQREMGQSGIDYAFGTLVGATVERVTTVGQPLRIRNASKSFGSVAAVAGVTLDLPEGEVTALFGGNGAGKSTLLRLIAADDRADSGEIFLGETLVKPRITERPIIVTPENLGLFVNFTVAENLAMGLSPRWLVDAGAEHWEASDSLRSIGSSIDPGMRLSELDAADRTIVAIARAVQRRASVIVLDEPTKNLSAGGASRVLRSIEMLRQQAITVVCVSHRIDQVFDLADHVVVMRDGSVVHEGAADDTCPDEVVHHIVGNAVA